MTLRVSLEEIVKADTSGVLGVHSTWARVRLSEVARVQNGLAFKSAHFSKDSGTPLLRIRDVGSNDPDTFIDGEVDQAYIVNRGDIVIGMDGDFRAARWDGPPAALNQRVCRVIPVSSDYDRRFLFHTLQPYLDAVSRATSAITVKHLSSATVGDLPLPLPSRAEQERIVVAIEEAFSKLDAGEAGLRNVRRLLKRMRDAVLAAAVTGRLVPQDPTDTPATKLLADVGTDSAEPADVSLPPIPEQWEWTTIGVLSQMSLGKMLDAKAQTGKHPTPYLRNVNVRWGRFDLGDLGIMDIRPDEFERVAVGSGDLVVCEGGEPGRCAVWREEPVIIQKALHRVRPMPGVSADYLALVLAWWTSRSEYERFITGTTIKHIPKEKLRLLPVPLPPSEEQARIVTEVERQSSFLDVCDRAIEAGLARAAALRRSVLKAAFEGKLVPQDPKDEPASVLLERIRAERAAVPKPARRSRSLK